MSAEEEEARRIAEMGKPILGEHSRLEVVIEESYEFKVHPFLYLLISYGRTMPSMCFVLQREVFSFSWVGSVC